MDTPTLISYTLLRILCRLCVQLMQGTWLTAQLMQARKLSGRPCGISLQHLPLLQLLRCAFSSSLSMQSPVACHQLLLVSLAEIASQAGCLCCRIWTHRF